MFDQFNYSLEQGLSVEEEDAVDKMLNTYGFFPDALIPGLPQYQTMQGGFDHRRIVGTTAQLGGALWSLNNLVLWCNKYSNPGQGLVSGMSIKRSALLGTAIPKNPFGIAFRTMASVSWAIVYYDAAVYALNFKWLQGKSFNQRLADFVNPLNYV